MGGSPGEFSEELVTQEKQKKGWRMNCDVGEATPKTHAVLGHTVGLFMGGLPGELNEEPVMYEKQKKGWRMSCDKGEATERLENKL